MVTAEERRALLAVPCPWCGAGDGEDCHVRETRTDAGKGTRRYTPIPVTTLDAGCHDARWRAALTRPAPVLTASVPRPAPERPSERRVGPVTAGVACPW